MKKIVGISRDAKTGNERHILITGYLKIKDREELRLKAEEILRHNSQDDAENIMRGITLNDKPEYTIPSILEIEIFSQCYTLSSVNLSARDFDKLTEGWEEMKVELRAEPMTLYSSVYED